MFLLQAAATTAPASGVSAFTASVAAAFAVLLSGIPRIIAFVLILLAGWIVAALVAKAVTGLLRKANFNALASKARIAEFIRRAGYRHDAASVAGMLCSWLVRIVAVVVAFDALGIHAIAGFMASLLVWIPNLIVAIAALVLGGIAARLLGDLVRGAASEAGFANAAMLSTVTHGAIMAFAIIIALNQVGVAQIVVNTLFIGTVAACALATGLAFGLGGQQRAAQMVDRWSERMDEARPQLARAGRRMAGRASPAGDGSGRRAGFAGVGGRPNFAERMAADRRAGGERRQLAAS
jgi:Conserved TM helix